MTEHISIDEMMAFIFAEKLDDDVLAASARIDAHMAQCDQCWETYSQLLAAKEAFDEVDSYMPRSERIAQKILLGLIKLQNRGEVAAVRISDCLSTLKAMVKLKVDNTCSLIGERLAGGQEYYNPALAIAAKSTGSDDEGPKVMQSTLVDENRNRVTIGPDGTLAAFFNQTECPEGTLVLLVSTEEHTDPSFQFAQRYDAHTMVARFEDVEPGEYIIVLRK